MKYLFFFTFFLFYVNGLLAQVPLGQEQAVEEQNAVTIPQQEDSLPAIFSDPSEIEMIEGLDEPLERVKLRDQDTNLILDMIQAITGRYILRPQNLPQVKINFDSMNILTKRETLLALESLLAMNGIGITKIDSQFYKAVPASGMNVHVPIWIDVPASSIAPSQRMYVKMFQLEYVPAEKMREILNPFATPNVSSLLIFSNSNSILITDSLLNLQRMEKIIEKTDISKEKSSFILTWYEPKRFSAEVLRSEFEAKYESFFKTDFHIKPDFIVPESNDQLGIYCHVLDLKLIKLIIEKIDIPILNPIRNELVELYHASAESVAKTLESFLDLSTPSTGSSKGKPATTSSTGKTSGASGGSSVASEMILSPFAKIIADQRSNGIFISGTQNDLDTLKGIITELDTPLPMARIDTIFVMVDLTASQSRGIDALFKDLHWSDDSRVEERYLTVPGPDKIIDTIDDETQKISDTIGGKNLEGSIGIPLVNSKLTFDMQKGKIKEVTWGQIFSVASQRKDVRIFSTPSITVIHGGGEDSDTKSSNKSKITITDSRNVGTRNYYPYNNERSNPASNETQNNISSLEAKTELSIQNPRIRKTIRDENGNVTELGTVFMSVSVTAEKFDETKTNIFDDQELPSIKSRYAETDLAIRDGQIMVLGGLQEVQLDRSESKFNLLSDIPYFGEKFFSPSDERYTPTELLIFIRPRILDPENPSDNLTDFNVQTLDAMMKKDYKPQFVSPSGKILGTPEKIDSVSTQDNPSLKPSI